MSLARQKQKKEEAIAPEITPEEVAEIRKAAGFLLRDYEDIDDELMGKSLLDARPLQDPRVDIAPAQGSPFLAGAPSMKDLLKHLSLRFRV